MVNFAVLLFLMVSQKNICGVLYLYKNYRSATMDINTKKIKSSKHGDFMLTEFFLNLRLSADCSHVQAVFLPC